MDDCSNHFYRYCYPWSFEGLAVGLLVSVIMFIHSYSKLPVIRLNASGCELRSSVDRSAIATRILDYYGSSIQVIYLQGYLFLEQRIILLMVFVNEFPDETCLFYAF